MLRCSQDIDWSRYGISDLSFFAYYMKARHVFDVPLLRANKRSKMDSDAIVDISAHEVPLFRKIQFTRIQSCAPEWLKVGDAAGSASGRELVVFNPPALGDLDLLFESDEERLQKSIQSGQSCERNGDCCEMSSPSRR